MVEACSEPPSCAMESHAGGDGADAERVPGFGGRETVERDQLQHCPLAVRQIGQVMQELSSCRLAVDQVVQANQVVLVDELATADVSGRPQLFRPASPLAGDDVPGDPVEPATGSPRLGR